jgi:hypothetical protein
MARNLIAFTVGFLTLLCAASAASAQSTYPTQYGGRVVGVVPLQCDTNGANCAPTAVVPGSASVVSGQVSVGTTATQIVAARAGRHRVTISSTGGAVLFVGPSGVTIANGVYIANAAGSAITLETAAAVFGVIGTGTMTVSYIEEF